MELNKNYTKLGKIGGVPGFIEWKRSMKDYPRHDDCRLFGIQENGVSRPRMRGSLD